MSDTIASTIRSHALSTPSGLPHNVVSDSAVNDAESAFGFELPPILKTCYAEVGNGGFGPGYGLIGLKGGAESDFGTLVDTYNQLKTDHESEGECWPTRLLPFCSWGCNIFSCVDCATNDWPIYLFEEGDVSPQSYNLETFFAMWIDGIDIMSFAHEETGELEIVNPFTGEKASIYRKVSVDAQR